MANPFNLPKLKPLKLKNTLPSDRQIARPLNPTSPSAQDSLDPEARKLRFRRLAGILGGLHRS